MLVVVIAIAVGMYVWPYLFAQKESPPVIELEKGSAIKLAKESIFYEWFIFYGGPFLRYYEEDYNTTAEKISPDAAIEECGAQLPERNYWSVNFCSSATCLKILIDYDNRKPVCFIQTTTLIYQPPYKEKLSYGVLIDKLTKEPIPNASVWGEERVETSGPFYSVYIVKQKTDRYGIYLIKRHYPNYIYSGISKIFIFKEGYAPTIATGEETELRPLEEGQAGIIIALSNVDLVSNFSLCRTDGECIDTFDKIALSEGEAELGYNIKPKLYLLGEITSGNYTKLTVDDETFNISIELKSKKLHFIEFEIRKNNGEKVLIEPSKIPTSDTLYWAIHLNEYTKINDTHYTHAGSGDLIAKGWKEGYHLTVLSNAGDSTGTEMRGGTIIVKGYTGDNVGNSMNGGAITINCEGVVEGDECTGDELGIGMLNGSIYIKGKAGHLAEKFRHQGGEIWEYWGTPRQRRIYRSIIPTSIEWFWNEHKHEYTKINDTHYTHPGNNNFNVGYSWMSGYHLTVYGNAGSVGDNMEGGTIVVQGNVNGVGKEMKGGTIVVQGSAGDAVGFYMGKISTCTIIINCEGVAEGGECTGSDLGFKMNGGRVYIKGKAGPLATGDAAPRGGEIWEYWGKPQQRRIFPAS